MNRLIAILLVVMSGAKGFAQSPDTVGIRKQTFVYAVKDSTELGLDVYGKSAGGESGKRPCVVFVFGGAFIGGRRDDTLYKRYFNSLVENNYIVVSISYRLGLRGVKNLSKYNTAPLRKAIDMAVDDVYDATNWTFEHADGLGIDTSKMILSGSSSGAITVLEADFDKRNDKQAAKKLPENFNYAGVIAFSGAILSFDGSLKYRVAPAPTMLFHGTADKIVPYDKIRFFNKGFYGSSSIARTFKKKQYPYYIYREEGLGHEVSVLPMYYNLPAILEFIDTFVVLHKRCQVDLSFRDEDAKPMMMLTANELFKKLQE